MCCVASPTRVPREDRVPFFIEPLFLLKFMVESFRRSIRDRGVVAMSVTAV